MFFPLVCTCIGYPQTTTQDIYIFIYLFIYLLIYRCVGIIKWIFRNDIQPLHEKTSITLFLLMPQGILTTKIFWWFVEGVTRGYLTYYVTWISDVSTDVIVVFVMPFSTFSEKSLNGSLPFNPLLSTVTRHEANQFRNSITWFNCFMYKYNSVLIFAFNLQHKSALGIHSYNNLLRMFWSLFCCW